MKVIALQSGSNGNCYVVEGGGVRLVVDAGISGRRARQRADRAGIDLASADGLLISHDHSDHARGAGIFHRMFGPPIYVTAGTMAGANRRVVMGHVEPPVTFSPGDTLRFGDLRVETIATPAQGGVEENVSGLIQAAQ